VKRAIPVTIVALTVKQQEWIKRRETRESPDGRRRAFVDMHLTWSARGTTINLKKLSTDEAQALLEILFDMIHQVARSKRYSRTRRSLSRKAHVVAQFLERGAVDRLGDVV